MHRGWSTTGPGSIFIHRRSTLPPSCSDVCQLHREIAPQTRIVEQFGPQPLQMSGDAKLLDQVFGNLLSNAIKYSPSGTHIVLSAVVDGDKIVVCVEDRGIGIPAADLARLFERYSRGSNVSGIVGTGIGLYLVKLVVDLHGGQIAVESREGHGSRFTVRLPINAGPTGSSAAHAGSDANSEKSEPVEHV